MFSQHLDTSSEREVVQLVRHFKLEQVIHSEEVEDPSIDPADVLLLFLLLFY